MAGAPATLEAPTGIRRGKKKGGAAGLVVGCGSLTVCQSAWRELIAFYRLLITSNYEFPGIPGQIGSQLLMPYAEFSRRFLVSVFDWHFPFDDGF